MKIPCEHEPKRPDSCYLCWKFTYELEYNLAYDGDGTVLPISRPGLIEKVVNYGAAALAHIADHLQRTPLDVLEARKALCESCLPPTGYYINGECTKCGCPVERKAAWRSARCPIGKW